MGKDPAPWRDAIARHHGIASSEPLTVGIVAPGVFRRRKRLEDLLGPGIRFVFGDRGPLHAIAGWGRKGTGEERAASRDLPYLALEDAFLARLGSDEKTFGLLGLVADPVGIYYDASRPSLVEQLIASSPVEGDADAGEAVIEEIRTHRLGKFNPLIPGKDRDSDGAHWDAIVVDQIAGDLSIAGGLASGQDFVRMLEAALDENRGGRVAVKLHPYDGVGGRCGHLREAAARYGVSILDSSANWITAARHAGRVYVVSSNAGLEALIAGAEVTCFGVPFFAGWGLTDDRQRPARRGVSVSLHEMAWAVYCAYGYYWLPSLRRRAAADELARFIAANQRHGALFGEGLSLYGTPRLKRDHVSPFLGRTGAPFRIVDGMTPRPSPAGREAVWAARLLKDPEAERAWQGRDVIRMEDGFLRSAGLGADLVRPLSLVADRRGIYFDPSCPSDLEHLLETEDLGDSQLRRGRALIRRIAERGLSKYNVGGAGPSFDPGGRRVLLVPGQVENDASILRGTGEVRTNEALLRAARTAHPDAFIAYKPHPDVEEAGRPGKVRDPLRFADIVLDRTAASHAIALSDEVHVMTSLIGFEALLRGRRVVTHGGPFYAGWGLTVDHMTFSRRTRRRSLEELAYLALIAYPLYISPLNGLPCSVEDVVEGMEAAGLSRPSIPGARRVLRFWRKLRTAPAYLR